MYRKGEDFSARKRVISDFSAKDEPPGSVQLTPCISLPSSFSTIGYRTHLVSVGSKHVCMYAW